MGVCLDNASTNILFPFKNSILKGINSRISYVRVSYDFILPFASAKLGLWSVLSVNSLPMR